MKTMKQNNKQAPVLLVMAAGMGSRYGGLKQMDPMGLSGELIMDFSVFDAARAGFQKVIFIIKEEMEADFKELIVKPAGMHIETDYVFQKLENIPNGFSIPQGRVKPWGTGHAVLSASHKVNGPFAVINADDFYGAYAFQVIYDFLKDSAKSRPYPFCMVGYDIENTISENGYVSRGVCITDAEGSLCKITERVHIEKKEGGIAYTEDDGASWTEILEGSPVSMNLWGFSLDMMQELENHFKLFLSESLIENPKTAEYFLPYVVNELLLKGEATVKVLRTPDKWYGITNKEDKTSVSKAICRMQETGIYPKKLWG